MTFIFADFLSCRSFNFCYILQVSTGKRSYSIPNNSDGGGKIFHEGNKFTSAKGLQAASASHFSLLMENLDALEATISSTDLLRLERDILQHLGRLGALKLFQTCLSKTLGDSTSKSYEPSHLAIEQSEGEKGSEEAEKVAETIVRSGKGRVRKMKQQGEFKKADRIYEHSLPSFVGRQPVNSSARRTFNSKRRRLMIAKSEAEMSKGIKVISDFYDALT